MKRHRNSPKKTRWRRERRRKLVQTLNQSEAELIIGGEKYFVLIVVRVIRRSDDIRFIEKEKFLCRIYRALSHYNPIF